MANLHVSSVGDYIREQREHAQVSLRALAKSAGVSNPYLSQIERGLKRPSAEILQQIAKGLRISAETLYVQAGILEDRGSRSDVVGAILADPAIGDRHKRVLLDIYESFRAEHVTASGVGAAAARNSGSTRPTAPRATAKQATAKRATAKQATAKQATAKQAATSRSTAKPASKSTTSRRNQS